ncbi:MAG: murein L,D-transpeptidase catalytic domain family protein [Sphingomonadaceae bacterium]
MTGTGRRRILAWALCSPLLAARPALGRAVAQDRLLDSVARVIATHGSRARHLDRIAVVDFARHSSEPRFFLVDREAGRITSHLVAHGRGSDPAHTGFLQRFSNAHGSNATSEGCYLTGDRYSGQHGAAMRLAGLDPTNDEAEARAIVIHAAPYVSPAMVRTHGKIGRSHGCFVLAPDVLPLILDRLGPGRLLLAGR